MDEENRYLVPEDEDFEPGSNEQVLKNLLRIKDKETIEHVEETELVRVGLELMEQYTPCNFNGEKLAEALGVVHVELIIIYPFREGNGRVARLLANLMTMQADYPALNFSSIDKTENQNRFNKYIEAIHYGFKGDYEPIKEIFSKVLEAS